MAWFEINWGVPVEIAVRAIPASYASNVRDSQVYIIGIRGYHNELRLSRLKVYVSCSMAEY